MFAIFTVCVIFTSSYVPAVVTTPLGLQAMEDGCIAAPKCGASMKKQWTISHAE